MVRDAAKRVLHALRDAHAPPTERRCQRCRWFANDREQVERELPGLLILSSAFGDSWGDAGFCRRHDVMLLPFHSCDDFAETAAAGDY